ncbi:MAG: DUF120 domain-containing protein [Deltaproteobacteria bacterium]|nr:DUF120 domain-containing protein [Deltaproteobacteria bacterium]
MIQKVKVKGVLFSGLGRGRSFIEIGWVSEGIKNLVGFTPYPGTLNLKISQTDFEFLMHMSREGLTLRSPSAEFCNAVLLKGKIKNIPCALIFPEETVWVHENTLEVIASLKLREKLGLSEGDEVEVEILRSFMPNAVIFDVDGTLIDSKNFFYELAQNLLKPYGISPSYSCLREAMNKGLDPWHALIPEDMPDRERVISELKKKDSEIFSDLYRKTCKLLPAVDRAIKELKLRSIKTALITTTWDLDAIISVFRDHGIDVNSYFDYVSITAFGEEKGRSIKKAIEDALLKLSVSPLRTLYVGDAEINIRVGRELKLATIGVLSGVGEKLELLEAGADAIISDLKELISTIEEVFDAK